MENFWMRIVRDYQGNKFTYYRKMLQIFSYSSISYYTLLISLWCGCLELHKLSLFVYVRIHTLQELLLSKKMINTIGLDDKVADMYAYS
jgi:hypothetical protein